MAESLTYTSLIADLTNYCERNDDPFLAQIPRFIMLAENRLASEVRGLGFLRVVNSTVTGNTLAKPARWRETKSISIVSAGEIIYLQSREYQYCRAFNSTSVTGIPRYYADYDYEHWFIAPTPASQLQVEIQYHERPNPLSDTVQTNWTTQYAPQLLLYATLMEAMPFLKTSERIPEFQGMYDRSLQVIIAEDRKRQQADNAAARS